jgi:hypothetical protein
MWALTVLYIHTPTTGYATWVTLESRLHKSGADRSFSVSFCITFCIILHGVYYGSRQKWKRLLENTGGWQLAWLAENCQSQILRPESVSLFVYINIMNIYVLLNAWLLFYSFLSDRGRRRKRRMIIYFLHELFLYLCKWIYEACSWKANMFSRRK